MDLTISEMAKRINNYKKLNYVWLFVLVANAILREYIESSAFLNINMIILFLILISVMEVNKYEILIEVKARRKNG